MGRKGGMKALLHKEVEKSQNWKKESEVRKSAETWWRGETCIHKLCKIQSFILLLHCLYSTDEMTFTFIHSFKQANQKCLHVSENNTHALMHYVLTLLTEKAPHIPTPWVCASTEQQVGERKDEGSEGEKVSLFHMPLFLSPLSLTLLSPKTTTLTVSILLHPRLSFSLCPSVPVGDHVTRWAFVPSKQRNPLRFKCCQEGQEGFKGGTHFTSSSSLSFFLSVWGPGQI